MRIITDDVQIFSMLEEHNEVSFNPLHVTVKHFNVKEGNAFFLFCPQGSSKGARLYITSSPPAPGEIENELLTDILQLKGDETLEQLREAAMDLVRNFLERKDNSSLYFDAH